jgi:hypothetical protein
LTKELTMKRSVLITLTVLAVPAIASAERHVFALAETRAIASPEAAGRILLGFESLGRLGDVVVSSAFLELPLPERTLEQDLEITVYGLSRGWRGQAATWTTPWNRPGGDLDESYFEEVTIPAGQATRTLQLNVTQIVDEIVTLGAPDYGFLLTTPLRNGDGFSAGQRALLGTLSETRLVVTTANARVARRAQG